MTITLDNVPEDVYHRLASLADCTSSSLRTATMFVILRAFTLDPGLRSDVPERRFAPPEGA